MPPEARSEPGAVGVECITPILRVTSLAISLRYYVEVLGFVVDWGSEEGSAMASVSRDGHSIMLCQGPQGQPGSPWAYEMQIEDPDGHVLRFGSDPKPA